LPKLFLIFLDIPKPLQAKDSWFKPVCFRLV